MIRQGYGRKLRFTTFPNKSSREYFSSWSVHALCHAATTARPPVQLALMTIGSVHHDIMTAHRQGRQPDRRTNCNRTNPAPPTQSGLSRCRLVVALCHAATTARPPVQLALMTIGSVHHNGTPPGSTAGPPDELQPNQPRPSNTRVGALGLSSPFAMLPPPHAHQYS